MIRDPWVSFIHEGMIACENKWRRTIVHVNMSIIRELQRYWNDIGFLRYKTRSFRVAYANNFGLFVLESLKRCDFITIPHNWTFYDFIWCRMTSSFECHKFHCYPKRIENITPLYVSRNDTNITTNVYLQVNDQWSVRKKTFTEIAINTDT